MKQVKLIVDEKYVRSLFTGQFEKDFQYVLAQLEDPPIQLVGVGQVGLGQYVDPFGRVLDDLHARLAFLSWMGSVFTGDAIRAQMAHDAGIQETVDVSYFGFSLGRACRAYDEARDNLVYVNAGLFASYSLPFHTSSPRHMVAAAETYLERPFKHPHLLVVDELVNGVLGEIEIESVGRIR